MGLNFEWDDKKSKNNFKKHSVSFEEAATVFGDPLSITIPDPLHSLSENRFIIMGESIQRRILVIIHVESREKIRIISARHGTKCEKKTYEEKN